jgi:hypothetical protein
MESNYFSVVSNKDFMLSQESQTFYDINQITPHKETCELCLKEILLEERQTHLTTCEFHIDDQNLKENNIDNSTEIIQCEKCSEFFGHIDIIQHFEECYSKKVSHVYIPLPKKEKKVKKLKKRLSKIKNKNNIKEPSNDIEMTYDENLSPDEKEKKLLFSLSREFQNEDLINDIQMKALKYVQKVSFTKSQNSLSSLLQKFEILELGKDGLDLVLNYIAHEAPIIIHFNPIKVLHFFVKDTNYRNQFETGTSGGSLNYEYRVSWENRLFNNIYDSAEKTHRVKYGVLNIVNDPFGVKSCIGYGDSYLVMNNDTVRLRTTFASGDSSALVELATCENYCHVLNTFSDKELIDLYTVASSKSFCLDSVNIDKYKEIQIHGPIIFSRDVSNIVIHHFHKDNPAIFSLANEFSMKFGVNLVWTE